MLKGQNINRCTFCKIVRKESPARILYEDEEVMAFYDINPQRKVHFLVIPKLCITMFQKIDKRDQNLMGRLIYVAKTVADQLDLKDGYRVVINNGAYGCQHVYHIHAHVAGGERCARVEAYGAFRLDWGLPEERKRMDDEIFMKILNKEVDSKILYEDGDVGPQS